MSTRTAYIFPGQGSQYSGMGKDLADHFPAARKVFEEADDALSFSISKMCFEGSAEELQLTENTQPAILTVSIAALRVMSEELRAPNPANGDMKFPEPLYVMGHSLGEYSALVAAGSLSFTDAVRTVRARGRYMQEAVPVGVGAMAAILGAALSDIEAACDEAKMDGEVCSPANINSSNQIVIAGHATAVERAMNLLKERGAKRVVKLNVSAPFHCALMMPAQERLAVDLENTDFEDLRLALISNVDATEVMRGEIARDSLIRQVSSPVRWQESVELAVRGGVNTFIEVGPGRVLSGLARQIDRSMRCLHVEDAASLEETRTALAAA